MSKPQDILLAIEDSEASLKAVEYAGSWVGSMEGVHIHLLHILPPLPPELLEFGGSEDPRVAEEMDARTRQGQQSWIENQTLEAAPLFIKVRKILTRQGVHEKSIHDHCCASASREEIVPAILETARAQRCATIAVGRHAFHGLHKLLGHHVSDRLVSKGKDLTVWVIE